MLKIIDTIFFVTVLGVFGLVILTYAFYITFFPLIKTIGGGLETLRVYSEGKAQVAEEETHLIPDVELGLTMADGGEKKKEESGKE